MNLNKKSCVETGLKECPCCGSKDYFDREIWEICSICNLENDPLQIDEPDYSGGANVLCLNDYKKTHEIYLEMLEKIKRYLISTEEIRYQTFDKLYIDLKEFYRNRNKNNFLIEILAESFLNIFEKVEKVQEPLTKNKVIYEELKKSVNLALIKSAYDTIDI